MEPIDLQISYREKVGSSSSRTHRKNGMLPAVVYKPGSPSTDILLNRHDFIMAAKGKPPTQVFQLKSDKGEVLSLVKSVQTEPLKGNLLHVEFLELFEGNNVIVNVPVKLKGTPACVKLNTAMVNQTAYEVSLECLPKAIPSEIILDISHMNPGDSIVADSLDLPEGVRLKSNAGLTIVSALINRRVAASAGEDASSDSAATPESATNSDASKKA